jgi:hypothetical protein
MALMDLRPDLVGERHEERDQVPLRRIVHDGTR